jgi:hypothetical protein
MARKRMIDPSLWEDEDLGTCSLVARMLFIGMFSNSDDYGRRRADARSLKRAVFGFDTTTLEEIEAALDELRDVCRSLAVYEVDGRRYVCFLKWGTYQNLHKPQPSQCPEPPGYQWTVEKASSQYERGGYTKVNPAPTAEQPENAPEPVEEKPDTPREADNGKPLSDECEPRFKPGSTEFAEKNRKEEKRKELGSASGDAPPDVPEKVKPLRPGVDLFREVFGRFPKSEFFARFEAALAAVGESLYRRRLEEWRDKPGCSPTNYADMLDVVVNGWLADGGGAKRARGANGAERSKPWEGAL